jgi:hypothetical protein
VLCYLGAVKITLGPRNRSVTNRAVVVGLLLLAFVLYVLYEFLINQKSIGSNWPK